MAQWQNHIKSSQVNVFEIHSSLPSSVMKYFNQCYEYRFGPCFGLSNGTEYFSTILFWCTVLRCFGVSKKIKNNIYLYFLIQHNIIDPNK